MFEITPDKITNKNLKANEYLYDISIIHSDERK